MTMLLAGARVLNTRPAHQALALTQAIEALGGDVIACPLLAIEPLATPWEKTLPPLSSFQCALFTSANAVYYFFERYPAHAWPATLPIIAIGHATAAMCERYQLSVREIPEETSSEGLLKTLFSPHTTRITRLLLIQGTHSRGLLEKTLTEQAVTFTALAVYQRTRPPLEAAFMHAIWQHDQVDIIIITSAQALKHLFECFEQDAHPWLRQKTYVLISQRLQAYAAALHLTKTYIASPHTLLEGIQQAYAQLCLR